MKRFRKSFATPFMIFAFDQMLMGFNMDYENEQEREQYIEKYIKDNKLSEKEAIELRDSIDELVKKVVEEKSKKTENK